MNSNFCDGLRASLRPLWMQRTEPAQFSFFLAAIIEPNSCSADIGNLFDTSSKFPNETIKWASSSGRHIKAAGCWHRVTFWHLGFLSTDRPPHPSMSFGLVLTLIIAKGLQVEGDVVLNARSGVGGGTFCQQLKRRHWLIASVMGRDKVQCRRVVVREKSDVRLNSLPIPPRKP